MILRQTVGPRARQETEDRQHSENVHLASSILTRAKPKQATPGAGLEEV